MNDLEMLSAYLDDELSTSQRAEIEEKLAQNSELQQELERLKQSDAMARSYFFEIDSQSLPLNIEAMILNAKPNEDKPENQSPQAKNTTNTAKVFVWPQFKAPAWGLASAASVLLAVGFWMNQSPSVSEIDSKLLSALETVPSGTVIDIGNELRVEFIASYQDQQGVVCRSLLEHTPQSSSAAVACFVKGQWQLEKEIAGEEYQTANSKAAVENALKEGLMNAEQEQAWLSEHN